MGNTLYLECFAGISGDMTVGALLDLGADRAALEQTLASLPIQGFKIHISQVKKQGLSACDFDVILDESHENHDHDMDYLHGERNADDETDGCQDIPDIYSQEESHHHHQESRNLADILDIIEQTEMTENAKDIAVRIFRVIAEAEAKVHGTELEQVHFHEVGAVDSIVDVISVAVLVDSLQVGDIVTSRVYEGTGYVRCQHGLIPIPVPAVAAIAASHPLKLHLTDSEGEFVTPTGAAIIAALQTRQELPATYQVKRVGMGAGKRAYERPSILRMMLLETEDQTMPYGEEDTLYKLESNIDDSTGEILGFCMERLLTEGARDVYFQPIFMKKNRPAYQLSVICTQEQIPVLEEIIFAETTTIGIRRIQVERTVLPREIFAITTSLGNAKIKCCEGKRGKEVFPEYESVAKLAREQHLSYRQVYKQIEREAYEQFCK